MRPTGVEPATYGFEVRRSIQLSYERIRCLVRAPFPLIGRVDDGVRTRDTQLHRLALYRLSYIHRRTDRGTMPESTERVNIFPA